MTVRNYSKLPSDTSIFLRMVLQHIDPLLGNGSINTFPQRPILNKEAVAR
jgi:hypothetical protein